MSHPYNGDIGRDLAQLKRRVDGLDRTQEDAQTKVRDLESQVDSQAEDHETLSGTVKDLRGELRTLRRRVERLGQQIDLAERRTRGDGVEPVDLDAADATITALIERSRTGRAATVALMTPAQRASNETAVEQSTNLRVNIVEDTDRAVAASRTMSSTPYGGRAHTAAVTDYRRARTRLHDHHRWLPGIEKKAAKARQALDADDAKRNVHGPQIMTGQAAHDQLIRHLRTRISAALNAAAPLPSWFHTALGYMPPATGTEEWMTLATEVLTWRVVNGVTDPVVALGPPPPFDDVSDHATGHRALDRRLRQLHDS